MWLASNIEFLLDFLFPPADTAKTVRTCTEETFQALYTPRRISSGAISLLPYRHPLVRAAVIEAKFHRNARAFSLLRSILRMYMDSVATEDVVIAPIPLGNARLRERGYNQVEEVAHGVTTILPSLLKRTRETKPQTSLSRRERLANVDGAFSVMGQLDPNVLYIVLDDVVTTGATLQAAADALMANGATSVRALALAH